MEEIYRTWISFVEEFRRLGLDALYLCVRDGRLQTALE